MISVPTALLIPGLTVARLLANWAFRRWEAAAARRRAVRACQRRAGLRDAWKAAAGC